MGTVERAIELEGTIDKDRRLVVEETLPVEGPRQVRVIVLVREDSDDVDERAWMRAAATNPAFDFLKEPEEDVYSPTDGKPFRGE